MELHWKENSTFYYLITSLNVRGFHYLIKCFLGVGKGGLEKILLTCLVSNFVSFHTKILVPSFYLLYFKMIFVQDWFIFKAILLRPNIDMLQELFFLSVNA